MSSDDRPELFGSDGRSAYESRGLVGALDSRVSRRDFLRYAGLAAGGTGLALVLAACGVSTGGSGGNPVSSATPASDYAKQIGLDLDVSTYDSLMRSRTGALTPDYQGWLDVLTTIQQDGLVDKAKLQSYVDYFGTVGQMTLSALGKTYLGWKHDKPFYPSTPFNPPEFLGWIDLNAMLPDFDIPTNLQNKENFAYKSGYPISADSRSIGLANWSVSNTQESTYFSVVEGYTNAVGTEMVAGTGTFDMFFERPTDTSGNPTVAWHKIYAANLIPGTIYNIDGIQFTFTNETPNYEESHKSFEFGVRVVVPEDDKVMLANISELLYIYAHTLPAVGPSNQDIGAFGFQNGSTIQPGQFLGYADPYLGPAFELDFTILAPADSGINFGPQYSQTNGGRYVLDIAGAKAYPQGQRPIATRTHWLDSRNYGPLYDANSNPINVPNKANMPF